MARADRVPFAFVWPLVAIRATVNDLDVFLVVDTGAQQTVIS